MNRHLIVTLVVFASALGAPATAQVELVQTDWSAGTTAVQSTDLSGEAGYARRVGHMFHETVPGALRAVQFAYHDASGVREIVPLRDTRSATVYYDYDGESGNPEAPVATCGTARS